MLESSSFAKETTSDVSWKTAVADPEVILRAKAKDAGTASRSKVVPVASCRNKTIWIRGSIKDVVE